MDRLIQTDANVNTRVQLGYEVASMTPLAIAAAHGNTQAVRALLSARTNVDSLDRRSWTPLRHAEAGEHTECVALLAPNTNVDSVDGDGETVLLAILREDPRLGDTLYEDVDIFNDSVVFLGDVSVLAYEDFSSTVWCESSSRPTTNQVERISVLLAAHVRDIDKQDVMGMTALSRAAKNHQWRVVRALLDSGARPNIEDARGMNALLWALRSPRRTQCFRNLNIFNGSRAWIGAATFLYQSRDSQPRSSPGDYGRLESLDDALEMLIENTKDLERHDFTGRTALSLASENGYVPVVKMLLDRHAQVDSRDRAGRSPLMWACMIPRYREMNTKDISVYNGSKVVYGTITAFIRSADATSSAPVDIVSQTHRTHRNEVIALLAIGVEDINVRDTTSRAAIHDAACYQLEDVMGVLQQYGASSVDIEKLESGQYHVPHLSLPEEPTLDMLVSETNNISSIRRMKIYNDASAVVSTEPGISLTDLKFHGGTVFILPDQAVLPNHVKLPNRGKLELVIGQEDGIDSSDLVNLYNSIEIPWQFDRDIHV